jgi:hypothetical protein
VKFPAACGVAEVFDALACEGRSDGRLERLPPAVGCGMLAARLEEPFDARPGWAEEPDEVVDEVGLVKALPSV